MSKSTPLRFSTVHGQNVFLGENQCSSTWKTDKHWGNCTTNRSLSKGETIELELTGSGHVYIGIAKTKLPHSHILDGKSPSNLKEDKWFHFRLKDNKIIVRLEKTTAKTVTYFVSEGDKKPEVFKIDECWVCCDLLFGDLQVKILAKDKSAEKRWSLKKTAHLAFDPVCGSNVSLSLEATTAKLKNFNPSAICCTDRPMVQGEVIEVKMEPVKDARWTYVDVYMSNLSPKDLKIDCSDFECSGSKVKTCLFPLTTLKNTQATFIVRVTKEKKIAYTVCGEENVCYLPSLDLSQPVYVYFDLFRVKLTLTSVVHPQPSDEVYLKINRLYPPEYQNLNKDKSDYDSIGQENPSGDGSEENDDDYLTPIGDRKQDDDYVSPLADGKQDDDYVSPLGDVKQDDDDYLTPIGDGKQSYYVNLFQDQCDTGNDETDGASGPVPEVGIIVPEEGTTSPQVGMTVNELGHKIACLRRSARADTGAYEGKYSVPLREIRQKLVSIEESSTLNEQILKTVKHLEKQVSEFILELSKTSESKQSGEDTPTKSQYEICIQPNYNTFLSDMEPSCVTDFLYQYEVITAEQMEKIHGMSKSERRQKNREILQLIRTKPNQMNLFKTALMKCGNEGLVKLIK